jgi:hypothetical protein
MSRTRRRGVIPFAKRFKNNTKPKPRASKKSQPLEQASDTKQRPFTLAPCQICGIIECGNASTGHESPIIVAISSKGASPAASSVFFKDNSIYNKTFIIDNKHLTRREIKIRTAITALEQIYAYATTKPKKGMPKTKDLTHIIIETDSKWLVKWFAARNTTEGGQFDYGKLSNKFDKLVKDISRRNEGRVDIKFCKAKNRTVPQQLAAAMLKGRKQARV